MTTTLQLKLRKIFITDDFPESLTNPAGDIFANAISAVTNFFQYLLTLFNNKFPPETRGDIIHRLFSGATPYLIVAGVLITWMCCGSCLFSCISAIITGCFNAVISVFRCVTRPISAIITGCFKAVMSVFRCVSRCLCCGGRSARKMMKAPGRPSMRLSRSGFEGNPRGYFRDLRGKPNNFAY